MKIKIENNLYNWVGDAETKEGSINRTLLLNNILRGNTWEMVYEIGDYVQLVDCDVLACVYNITEENGNLLIGIYRSDAIFSIVRPDGITPIINDNYDLIRQRAYPKYVLKINEDQSTTLVEAPEEIYTLYSSYRKGFGLVVKLRNERYCYNPLMANYRKGIERYEDMLPKSSIEQRKDRPTFYYRMISCYVKQDLDDTLDKGNTTIKYCSFTFDSQKKLDKFKEIMKDYLYILLK